MTQDERIDQFRKMAKANPDDDLAHYALGQALLDADRPAEAVNVLRHVLKLNDGYSRAYVLLGQAQSATGDEEGAIETWQRGYGAAMNRGDLMPANELKGLLQRAGVAPSMDALIGIDAPPDADDGREPGEDEVRCIRSRRIGQRMASQPFEDEIGAYIQAHVCVESWEAWMEMSIKVINELRLDLGDPEGQRAYDEHMRDFLNLPGTLFEGRDYGE